MNALALRAFYLVKPLIPRRAQVAARRVRARRLWRELQANPLPPDGAELDGYAWPDGVRSCALVTHDVELAGGQARIGTLTAIEERMGIRSCWNFPVCRYPVDERLIGELRDGGHEVGVHGTYHDGREFASEAVFRERLKLVEDAAARWGAVGFRAPSLLYDRALLATLPFEWDSSMPAWDPFQPKPGDCRRYFPFDLSERCLELPVTLWQDFTLLDELGMRDIDVWRRQADAIHARGGLITVIVHPDYIDDRGRVALYTQLLEHLRSLEGTWIATPSEVVAWARRGERPADLSR